MKYTKLHVVQLAVDIKSRLRLLFTLTVWFCLSNNEGLHMVRRGFEWMHEAGVRCSINTGKESPHYTDFTTGGFVLLYLLA